MADMTLNELLTRMYNQPLEQSSPEPFDQVPQANTTGDDQLLPTSNNGFHGTDVNGLYGWQRELVIKARNHDKLTPMERDLIAQLTISAITDGLSE
jgi:hypothetical protein